MTNVAINTIYILNQFQPKEILMQKKIYFAYGANTNKQAMARRCPKAKPIGAGHIVNYKLKFNNVADIVKVEDHIHDVPCVIWEIKSLAKDPWIDSRVIRHCMTRLR